MTGSLTKNLRTSQGSHANRLGGVNLHSGMGDGDIPAVQPEGASSCSRTVLPPMTMGGEVVSSNRGPIGQNAKAKTAIPTSITKIKIWWAFRFSAMMP